MRAGQPNRSGRQIAAGLSRVDTMDRGSERRGYDNRNDGCEDCYGHLRPPRVEIVVH
jgi:hypothetical protein